jgi:hypothetical protein
MPKNARKRHKVPENKRKFPKIPGNAFGAQIPPAQHVWTREHGIPGIPKSSQNLRIQNPSAQV